MRIVTNLSHQAGTQRIGGQIASYTAHIFFFAQRVVVVAVLPNAAFAEVHGIEGAG